MFQVFELLTGEYLFDPKETRTYRKDEDHVAQMIELLGDFPAHFIRSGMYANEIFNSRGNSRLIPSAYVVGQLRNIHRLTYWGLAAVLKEKYNRGDFALEADFMSKMLDIVPSRRADAGGMVGHEWLRDTIGMENLSVGRPVGGRGQGIAGWSEVVKTNRQRR
jgi:serine/threonine-protein kinase SRPK3